MRTPPHLRMINRIMIFVFITCTLFKQSMTLGIETFDVVWVSDDCGLSDGGMLGEDVLDLGRAQPVTAHIDHVVHATRDLQK